LTDRFSDLIALLSAQEPNAFLQRLANSFEINPHLGLRQWNAPIAEGKRIFREFCFAIWQLPAAFRSDIGLN